MTASKSCASSTVVNEPSALYSSTNPRYASVRSGRTATAFK